MEGGLPKLCEERARLLNLYRETATKYAETVREMSDLAGIGLHSEVDVLRRACRAAWDKTEQARLALFVTKPTTNVIGNWGAWQSKREFLSRLTKRKTDGPLTPPVQCSKNSRIIRKSTRITKFFGRRLPLLNAMQKRSRFKLYRIKNGLPAVKRDGTSVETRVHIYSGTVVLVISEPRPSGYVDVFADGEFLSVLTRHLEEHAELAAGNSAFDKSSLG